MKPLTDNECLALYRRVWWAWGPALDADTALKVRSWLDAATLSDAVKMPDWVTSVCRECGNANGTEHEARVRKLRQLAGTPDASEQSTAKGTDDVEALSKLACDTFNPRICYATSEEWHKEAWRRTIRAVLKVLHG